MNPEQAQRAEGKELVFEIGAEELPATNLAGIFESDENPLLEKWKKAFLDNRIAFGEARVWATPRRLVFYLTSVVSLQEKRDQLTRLLSKQEAYDASGNPTEKFLTILKHRNAKPEDATIADSNGKEFVFLRKAEPVRKTSVVLPELLEAFVKSLSFPKNMKWDDSGVYFPRPIRQTLCFFGHETVKFKIGRTRSSDKVWIFSRGKRTAFTVSDASSYFRVLKKQGVILEQEERKKTIQGILERMAKAQHAKLYDDPFLMSEVNFLVENPQGLAAPFDEEFLKLPLEVLTVSMARKQRIFGLVDKDGCVQPRFLAILDGAPSEKDKKEISKNFENILHAKLQDSLFFYKEDMKLPLEKRRDELKNLIFLKGAGSMLEKSERLMKLSRFLAEKIGMPDTEKEMLMRSAKLCKADLLTQMVGEFPELQGVMGKYYAKENGESPDVTLAIGEQYLPRTISDPLPQTKIGTILSLLDKVDLIVACFLLRLEPTSSLDPYGLRRSGNAVVRMLINKKIKFDFSELIRFNASLFSIPGVVIENKLCGQTGFFWDRFRAILSLDIGGDIIDAVAGSKCDNFVDAYDRADRLRKIKREDYFEKAHKIVERTHNILKGNKEVLPAKPDKALFTEELERSLHEKFERHAGEIHDAINADDFARATSLYAEAFFDTLNQFFEKVFINAEDLNVRKNRLSLLKAVNELYTNDIADLSRVAIIQKREIR